MYMFAQDAESTCSIGDLAMHNPNYNIFKNITSDQNSHPRLFLLELRGGGGGGGESEKRLLRLFDIQ